MDLQPRSSEEQDEVRPGYRTTEFWLSLIVVVVAAVSALVQVYRGQLDAAGAVAIVSGAVAAVGYSHSRATVKAQS